MHFNLWKTVSNFDSLSSLQTHWNFGNYFMISCSRFLTRCCSIWQRGFSDRQWNVAVLPSTAASLQSLRHVTQPGKSFGSHQSHLWSENGIIMSWSLKDHTGLILGFFLVKTGSFFCKHKTVIFLWIHIFPPLWRHGVLSASDDLRWKLRDQVMPGRSYGWHFPSSSLPIIIYNIWAVRM